MADNDVVISGISGRFPESDNLEEFWENLINGVDMVTETDRRWPIGIFDLPRRKGTLKTNLETSDHTFFKITRKQAEKMDPQISLLLEVAFEAVLDAGVNPTTIRGSNTGVFAGSTQQETLEARRSTADSCSAHDIFGSASSFVANRISYQLDLKGPSYTLDTYCSSSMIALHNAATAIRHGECEAAIVCGTNLLFDPLLSRQVQAIGVLSNDGKCKTFDAAGDGYVRSEAIVAVFLQKRSMAKRNYGTIVHSKSSSDGYKSGISYPSSVEQGKLMIQTYMEAGIHPKNVDYVEAHGTGTSAGDKEELTAVANTFFQDRTEGLPLLIGSVKSNMGHPEAAAGLCALAKVILSTQHGVLPPNLHFKNPNPNVPFLIEQKLKVVTEPTPFNGSLVSLNASGIGGSNAHVIFKTSEEIRQDPIAFENNIPFIAPFCARTEEALEFGLQKIATARDDGMIRLLQSINEVSIPGFDYRGTVVFDKNVGVVSEIEQVDGTVRRCLWYIFPGLGSQWVGMAKDMMVFPLYKKSIENSALILKEFGIDLTQILTTSAGLSKYLGVACMAAGIALIDLMVPLGLKPNGLIGHSAGEILCAYYCGCISAREGLLINLAKDELSQVYGGGGMAAIGLTWEEALVQCPPGVFTACHNGSNSATVSGYAKNVGEFVQELKSKNIFAKEIDCGGISIHSPIASECATLFHEKLSKFMKDPIKRPAIWISTSIPEGRWHESIAQTYSIDYVVNNFVSPVYFYEACKHIPENAVVVELSSTALFRSILKNDLPKTCSLIGLMKRNAEDNPTRFVSAVGSLFQYGFNPKLSKLYPECNFPVKTGTGMIAPLVKWNREESITLPDFVNKGVGGGSNQIVEISLNSPEDKFLQGHKIDGRVLFPAAGYLVLVWKAFAKMHGADFQNFPVQFQNVRLERATILSNSDVPVKLKINILEVTGQFEISEGASIVTSGRVNKGENFSGLVPANTNALNRKKSSVLVHSDIYKWFYSRGYEYEGLFQGITAADTDQGVFQISWSDNWISFLDTMIQVNLFRGTNNSFLLPTGLDKLTIDPNTFLKFMENNNDVHVKYSHMHNYTCAPGIEIRELKFSQAPRREKIQPLPALEEYRFVPYIDSNEVTWERETALKLCLDVILENTSSRLLKIVVGGIENSIGHEMEKMNNSPGRKVQIELMELNSSTISRPNTELHDVLIVTESTSVISKYAYLVKPGGFVLFLSEKMRLVELVNEIGEQGWCSVPVVYKRCANIHFYVLRKDKTEVSPSLVIVVEIDSRQNWINTVKSILLDNGNPSPSILLHSSNEEDGILGLVNCLRAEPGGSNIRCVFSPGAGQDVLQNPILQNNLAFNVLNSQGELGSYRHLKIPGLESKSAQGKNMCLKILTKGQLASLRWIEVPKVHKEEGVCDVHFSALNFRDVMVATGTLDLPRHLTTDDNALGVEFVGMDFKGERVMGIVSCNGFANQVRVDRNAMLWPVPPHWKMEEAGTVPVAYSTAYYALVIRGQIQPGETVLIHSGAGSVGQAAIRVALSYKCQVFVTVGSMSKREYLMKIFPEFRDHHFASSRTTDFREHFLQQTNGRGIDVILNSLAEEKLQASLEVLAENGRFLEIGKYDMMKNSSLGMLSFLKNISFHGILLEQTLSSSFPKNLRQQLYDLVQNGIDLGVVKPLDHVVFSAENVEEAFRLMNSGQQVGKILVKIQDTNSSVIPRTFFHPEKIYIIVGGLGGVGLEMAGWLVSRGARKLALVSRSGIVNGFQLIKTKRWIEEGTQVLISQEDVTTLDGARKLMLECQKLGPIGGIFNLAMVLRDAIFTNQTVENFVAVLKPKISITHNLDILSRKLCSKDLEYFVVFTSISSGRGNAGQSNYGMANSSMERICESRKRDGLPGLGIQWGPIAEVGVVHENMKGVELVGGAIPQFLASCLEALDRFLYFQDEIPTAVVSSFVFPEAQGWDGEKPKGENASLPDQIGHILGLKNTGRVPNSNTLGDLGADSLIAVELQHVLQEWTKKEWTTNAVRLLTWEELRNVEQANIG